MFPFASDDTQTTRVGDLPMRTIPAIAGHLPISAARKVAALKGIALLLVERNDQIVGTVEESILPVVAGGFVLGAVTRADIERAKTPANER